uniref:MSP domain-containing protein n=1 Tax=Heligmosomoides polygyrus TaxID=6339 RepID=A0A183FFN7_HELPZ
LVRNSYPKKITYVFFPLPGDGSEAAFKKVPTFSCLPKVGTILRVYDVVPPNTKNDLKEAFDAAVQYLKAKGLTKVCKPSLIMLSSFPSGEWALKKLQFKRSGHIEACFCYSRQFHRLNRFPFRLTRPSISPASLLWHILVLRI